MIDKPLKINASWAITGNICLALGRLAIIMILAKAFAHDSADLGQFMFAIAVVTPLAILFNLESRSVYVTDSQNKIEISNFLTLRIISNALYLITLAIICLFFYDYWGMPKTSLIILMGMVRTAESLCDIFLSVLQKNEKMKYWAISQILKTILILGWAFAMWTFQLDEMWLMPIGWLTATIIIGYFFDYQKTKKITKISLIFDKKALKTILFRSWPIALFVTFSSFNSQIGQYFIEWRLTDKDIAYFGAIMHFMAGPMAIQNGFNQAMLARLAKYFQQDISAFLNLLLKMTVYSSVAMIIMLIILKFWSGSILTFIYTKEYALHSDIMFIAGVGTCLILWSMILGDAIMAAHKFKGRLFAVIVGLAANIIICYYSQSSQGIKPIAFAMLASAAVITIICLAFLVIAIKDQKKLQM